MLRRGVLTLLERIEPPGRDRIADALLAGRAPFERRLGNGVRIGIDPSDRIERRFAIRSYERPLLRFLSRTLQPGDAVIDGGAHVGYIALHAGTCVAPDGLVVAVEPDPANLVRLRANIARNELPVVVEAAALGREPGAASFVRDLTPGETGWGSLLTDPGPTSESVDVRVTTLDALAASLGERPLRLVKLDVQGAEHDALLGAIEMLAHQRPILVLETVDVWWGSAQRTTVADVRALVAEHGYTEHGLSRMGALSAPGGATGVFVPG